MIFRNFMRLFYKKPFPHENQIHAHTVAKFKRHQWLRELILKRELSQTMSSVFRFRMIFKDLSVKWSRNALVSAVVRRCRRDGVKEMLQCFRQTILRPRRTFLLSATAACKTSQEDHETPKNNITDEELSALTSEMDKVEELMRATLYCTKCGNRLPIDKKQPGICYCSCAASAPRLSEDGWEPYLEAEDVVIWRRQYNGPGLYAYKVYGRYKEVSARDFANVQLDTAYRRVWDSAVASLALIEEEVNGLRDQALLHWEVLWPRLFANRDYVYLRRHREYEVVTRRTPGELSIIRSLPATADRGGQACQPEERSSVHSRARRRVLEEDAKLRLEGSKVDQKNRLFVIVSKSCESDKAPATKHAIRVTEYWSQMVVRSIEGDDQPGMEFVLTYYDEPGVGGMPGVASWAAGRAAPAYLAEMRRAAGHYLGAQTQTEESSKETAKPVHVEPPVGTSEIPEQDMESSKQGPDLDAEPAQQEESKGQSSPAQPSPVKPSKAPSDDETQTKQRGSTVESQQSDPENREDGDESIEEDAEKGSSWWSYLYPFYYFV